MTNTRRLLDWGTMGLFVAVLALAPARAQTQVDANGDGLSDVDNILRKIDELAHVGVKFDDEGTRGHIPALREGKYHMACIDLILVVYRAAGYDIAGAMLGGPLIQADARPPEKGLERFRQIVNVVDWLRKSPDFNFYPSPPINLNANRAWRPRVPCRVGDMLFVHYDDANDRHSGIVTGVDPATGLPTYITQVSIYNENEGMHRATAEEFFALKCRMLTGIARPVVWDGGKVTPEVMAELERDATGPKAKVARHDPRRRTPHHPRRPPGPVVTASRRRAPPARYLPPEPVRAVRSPDAVRALPEPLVGGGALPVWGAPQPARTSSQSRSPRRSRRGGSRQNGAAAAATPSR